MIGICSIMSCLTLGTSAKKKSAKMPATVPKPAAVLPKRQARSGLMPLKLAAASYLFGGKG